ncbi:hypothetical protein Q0Z83_065810 [Actinoplanes sichuanensis]|uniref:Uncharacterized protein n=1 Tax=Actinoplanes sichuanensis TaxID=512349 RepID=A0ABW4AMT2_9ACTN|nr:hypothetical protein [Actinoplanes sichuanensis]BEL08390.1 hypothetical protein Q0Z83_065810 [Actinoplanes sichuanensis]
MPVSRKRKKSAKSTAAVRAERRRAHTRQVRLAQSLAEIVAGQEQGQAMRLELAHPHAVALAAELMTTPKTGTALEDELCARLGPLLAGLAELPLDAYVGPDHLTDALAGVLLDAGDDEAARRVLAALAAILPSTALDRTGLDAPDPQVAGEVRWTRDRWGSRFAVLAPFATPEGPVRWYLWDIDACAFVPVAVHAGFYASPEEALAAWQVGVGAFAAGGTSWRRIDDFGLLLDLLPKPDEVSALGGESAEQFTEYHRCRRLAEAVLDLPPVLTMNVPETALDLGPERFVTWWRTRAEGPEPANLKALTEEMFDSWPILARALFDTCSPHRVESVSHQIREEYREDADELLALLPAWVTWLSERTGLPAELRERALARTGGATTTENDLMRRVVE